MAPTKRMSSSGEEDKSKKKKKQKQALLHTTISQKSQQWSSVNSEYYKGKRILLSTSIYNFKVPREEEGTMLFQYSVGVVNNDFKTATIEFDQKCIKEGGLQSIIVQGRS